VTKITELICDGCEKRAPSAELPSDWRRLTIRHGLRSWTADVCSPFCASRAVDRTYEAEDRREAVRRGLRAV
jgi:hypothetical protein